MKVDGKRAYDLARKGRDFELKAKPVEIHELELLAYDLPQIKVRVACSKGTYIRSLARDLGKALGSGGRLTDLQRTQVGDFRLEDCFQVSDIRAFLEEHAMTLEEAAIAQEQENE